MRSSARSPRFLASAACLIVSMGWSAASSAAPRHPGADPQEPDVVDLLEQLHSWILEHPDVREPYFNTSFVLHGYEALGRRAAAKAIYDRQEADAAILETPQEKARALAALANEVVASDPLRARRLIAETERLVSPLPAHQRTAMGSLDYAYVQLGDYRKALDCVAAAVDDGSRAWDMFDYLILAQALAAKKATEPLTEVRKIIRDMQSPPSAPVDGVDEHLESMRIQALACAELPDEAAEHFLRLPCHKRYDNRGAGDMDAMRYVAHAYIRANRRDDALEFLKRNRGVVLKGHQSELAVVAARAGDFDLADSFIAASGDHDSLLQLRALTVLAHRAGNFALRDKLYDRFHRALQTLPPDPKQAVPTDPKNESAIVDALLGRYAEIQRLISVQPEKEAFELRIILIMVLVDKQSKARGGDWGYLDAEFLLAF